MSQVLSRFLTSKCTVWRSTGEPDLYGQITYGPPEVLPCGYREGGKLTRDKDGNQFVPYATFYLVNDAIKLGDIIEVGELSGPPAGQMVRKVERATELRGAIDVAVMTG